MPRTVTVGLFAFNVQGLEGSMIVMLSHGLVSGALFLCVGVVYDRLHSRDIDRYGRTIAVCSQDGVDLNAWMVREGWAVAYRQYSQDYVSGETDAQGAGRNIWSGSFVMPWDWRGGARSP